MERMLLNSISDKISGSVNWCESLPPEAGWYRTYDTVSIKRIITVTDILVNLPAEIWRIGLTKQGQKYDIIYDQVSFKVDGTFFFPSGISMIDNNPVYEPHWPVYRYIHL